MKWINDTNCMNGCNGSDGFFETGSKIGFHLGAECLVWSSQPLSKPFCYRDSLCFDHLSAGARPADSRPLRTTSFCGHWLYPGLIQELVLDECTPATLLPSWALLRSERARLSQTNTWAFRFQSFTHLFAYLRCGKPAASQLGH